MSKKKKKPGRPRMPATEILPVRLQKPLLAYFNKQWQEQGFSSRNSYVVAVLAKEERSKRKVKAS